METRIEQTILKNLIQNEEFTRKCIPFLKPEYFTDISEKTIYEFSYDYFQKYTKPPTVEALLINLENSTSLNEKILKDAKAIVKGFGGEEGYIHKKFKLRGDQTICLPFLRWLHRFQRPNGVRYVLTMENKVRNYILGAIENNEPFEPIIDHFTGEGMPQNTIESMIRDIKGENN